jgi:uncharacterized membrane protein YoaK (UPF0700 family)
MIRNPRMSSPDADLMTPRTSDPPLAGLGVSLPVVLSMIAGSVDVIGLYALDMFTSHITGNLVLLAARVVGGEHARIGQLLSVPVFVVVLVLTKWLGDRLESIGLAPLRSLLLLQFVLIAGLLAVCVATAAFAHPDSASAILAGILGVSAMAVQTTIVLISLKSSPTVAMTMSIARFTLDVSEILSGGNPAEVADARRRTRDAGYVIGGFAAGCAAGAASAAAVGPWSLALPAGLAALAFTMTGPDVDRRP